MKKQTFCIGKNKEQISFAVTTKLISTLVFTTGIVQFFYFIDRKFPTSAQPSVAVQPGLCWTCSEPQSVGFLMTWLNSSAKVGN